MSEKSDASIRRPGWIRGAILIFLGLVFLLQNVGLLTRSGNWWAVFIFIPAFILLSQAYATYGVEGNALIGGVLVQAALGLFFAGLALVLLLDINLDINWDLVWPVILVLIGLGLLLRRSE